MTDFMGAFTAFGNTLLGIGGSARAVADQYGYNLALQKQAQEWNEYMYKNRYQMQVEDLKKAGINPLYGLGSAPSVTSGMNSVGMPDYVGEQNNKLQFVKDMINTIQTISANRANINLTKQKTETERENTQLMKLEQINKNLDILYKKGDLNNQERKQKAELENLKSQTLKNLSDISVNKSQIKLNKEETTSKKLANENQGRYNKFAKEHPYITSMDETLKRHESTINTWLQTKSAKEVAKINAKIKAKGK